MSNLLINRSFEEALTSGWGTPTAGVSRSAARAYSGSYSCLHANPTATYSARSIESDKYAALPGWTYRLGLNIYVEDTGSGIPPSSSTNHVRARMVFYDSGMTRIQYGYWMNWYPPTHLYAERGWTDIVQWDQWIYRQFDFVAPAGTAFISALIETREEDNPFPPPIGPPDNNVYIDLVYLGAGESSYSDKENRVVGGIGSAHSQTDHRVAGYLLDRNYDEVSRISGRILTDLFLGRYLVKGQIGYKYEYYDEPDAEFLQQEDNRCSSPRKQLIIYHPDFPEQDYPGPDGSTRYIDLTDRVISYGELSREVPSRPGDMPVVAASDMSITVDNTDYYFTKANSASFLHDIENFVGWKEGAKIELWSGFLVRGNTVKLIQVAKMVIIRITTDSAAGTATIDLRDYAAAMLDKIVGKDDPAGLPPGPLEYPRKIFDIASGYIKMRHSNASAIYRNINIGTWAGLSLGKIARAKLMQDQMNKPLADGGLVTAAEETFSVTFDEETQLYTFSATNVTWIQFYADTPTAERFGFTLAQYYPSGPGFPPSGSTEIIAPNSMASDTENFTDLLEALFSEAGYDPSLVDIQSLPIEFMNVSFSEKTILDCVSQVAQCGSGLLWMDRVGKIWFRRFDALDMTVKKELAGDVNYQTAIYAEQDADLKIRELSVKGKFESAYASVNSGVEVGSEVAISNDLVETQALAEDVADRIYRRYNVAPAYIEITGEYLPSLGITDTGIVVIAGNESAFQGQVVSSGLQVGDFVHRLTIQPVISAKTWEGRADWEDYVAEDATERLICPWSETYLQMRLLEYLQGYRVYQFDCLPGSAGARSKWIDLTVATVNEDGIFFRDCFDDDPVGRYDYFSREIQANGYPVPAPGPFAHYISGDDRAVRINSGGVDDRITFIRPLGLLDETPGHFLDYQMTAEFMIDQVYKYVAGAEWGNQPDQAKGHYFGAMTRIANLLHCNWSLLRAGGLQSPMVGYLAGSTHYLSVPTRMGSQYTEIGKWQSLVMGAVGTALSFEADGVTPRQDMTTPVFTPWTFPSQVAVGFSRCLGYIRRLELYSPAAASAPEPTFEYRTSDDTISWSAWGSSLAALAVSKYIQVKVYLQRDDKYMTIPKIRRMTLSYNRAD